MELPDNILLRNHTIKYNLIFSDAQWKEFHDIVQAVMGADLLLPELLALYNRLPEYVQSGLMRIGFNGLEYHLTKLMDDDAFQVDLLKPVANGNNTIVPFKPIKPTRVD